MAWSALRKANVLGLNTSASWAGLFSPRFGTSAGSAGSAGSGGRPYARTWVTVRTGFSASKPARRPATALRLRRPSCGVLVAPSTFRPYGLANVEASRAARAVSDVGLFVRSLQAPQESDGSRIGYGDTSALRDDLEGEVRGVNFDVERGPQGVVARLRRVLAGRCVEGPRREDTRITVVGTVTTSTASSSRGRDVRDPSRPCCRVEEHPRYGVEHAVEHLLAHLLGVGY